MGLGEFAFPGVEHIKLDLTDEDKTQEIVGQVRPERVFHLAGNSRVTELLDIDEYFSKNFLTTVALVKALTQLNQPTSLFFSSSVHVYGNREEIVDETATARPVSLYGFTKYLAEQMIQDAVEKKPHLRCVVGRLYSCVGPGQGTGFVAVDLCNRVAKLGPEEPLRVGPLDGYRSFLDVRDAVALFPQLLSRAAKSRYEIVNIASPHELEIREILNLILRISGKSPTLEATTSPHSNRFRGLRVSTEKMRQMLDSPPAFRPIQSTLSELYQSIVNAQPH